MPYHRTDPIGKSTVYWQGLNAIRQVEVRMGIDQSGNHGSVAKIDIGVATRTHTNNSLTCNVDHPANDGWRHYWNNKPCFQAPSAHIPSALILPSSPGRLSG